jgi:hypothetical protein
MSQSFKNNNCFGANREPLEAGDYIQKKKARATYCNSNVCIKKNTGTYENYNLLRGAQQLDKCSLPFDKYDLNRNLFTQLNTSGLCVLRDASNNSCATTIDPSLNIYDSYIIDPSGDLFGNSFCGINNFVNLMEPINNISYDVSGNYIISSNSDYNTIITFTGNGTFRLTSGSLNMDIVSVGGGGGGGSGLSNGGAGGGGGGGEVINGSYFLNVIETMNITIGNGGNGGLTNTALSPTNTSGGNGQNTTILHPLFTIISNAGLGGVKAPGNGGNGGNGGLSGSNGNGGSGSTSPSTLPTIGINGGGGGGGGYLALNGANGSTTTATGFLNIQNYGAGGGGGAGDGSVTGGAGGNIYAGNGGIGVLKNGSSAIANYGGGGGGGTAGNGIVGTSGNGGNGSSGLVILAFNV